MRPQSPYLELYHGHVEIPEEVAEDAQFVPVCCPFHEDASPSAGISLKTGVFNCYVCGSFGPAQFLHKISGMELAEAYQMMDSFRTERELIEKVETYVKHLPSPAKSAKFLRLYEESQKLMSPDRPVVKDYLQSRRLTYETLLQAKVGFLPESATHWHRDSLVFPYFHSGKVVGIRYRDQGANKGGEEGCHFTLWGVDDLEDETDLVLVVEGETDRLATLQAVQGKYPVLSTPTAAFRKEWSREFDGVRQVLLIPQADEPSLKMVKAFREHLETGLVIQLPWRRREVGNDVCDWLKYHPEADLSKLIDQIAEPSTRRILSGAEFQQASGKPRQWLIENFLARGQIGVIGGPPKAHKTWFALNLIRSMLIKEDLCNIPGLCPPLDQKLPKILILEEEGDIEGLNERVQMVLGDTPWMEQTCWGHHLGTRLDQDAWIDRLDREILARDLDLLIIDPFHRTYAVDEDSASEMGQVWNRVARLISRFPHLSILILHHFNKSGSVEEGWKSFRGSNRIAAEADLGVFVESRPKSEGGAKIKIEGRSIMTPMTAEGKEVFPLNFVNGILTYEVVNIKAGSTVAFFEEVQTREPWKLIDAANHYKVTSNTIRHWVAKWAESHSGTSKIHPFMAIVTLEGEACITVYRPK